MGLIAVLAETGAVRRLLQQAAGTGALPDRTLWPAAEVDHCLGMLADASLLGFAGNEDRDLVAAHRLVMRVVRERHAETGDLAVVTDGAVRALQASASTIGDAWADPDGFVTWPPASAPSRNAGPTTRPRSLGRCPGSY